MALRESQSIIHNQSFTSRRNSVISQISKAGPITDAVWSSNSEMIANQHEKLKTATQDAKVMSDVHNIDKDTMDKFPLIGGDGCRFNNFNCCRLISCN